MDSTARKAHDRSEPMAIEHMYTILCEGFMEGKDGKHAYFGTFVNLGGPKMPILVPRVCIAVGYTAAEGDEYRITIEAPDGEQTEIGRQKAETVQPDEARAQVLSTHVSVLEGLALPVEGTYAVVLWDTAREEPVHRRPFGRFRA